MIGKNKSNEDIYVKMEELELETENDYEKYFNPLTDVIETDSNDSFIGTYLQSGNSVTIKDNSNKYLDTSRQEASWASKYSRYEYDCIENNAETVINSSLVGTNEKLASVVYDIMQEYAEYLVDVSLVKAFDSLKDTKYKYNIKEMLLHVNMGDIKTEVERHTAKCSEFILLCLRKLAEQSEEGNNEVYEQECEERPVR